VVGALGDDERADDAGAAYVFRRDATGAWTQEAKLVANDGTANDRLGEDVAIDGATIAIGGGGDYLTHAGVVYVFERTGTLWTQTAKLAASDAEPSDFFGAAVALSGDWIAVGSWGDDDECPSDPYCESGSCYLFARNGTGWSEAQKVRSADAARGDQFGHAVALSGDRLVVGAHYDTTTSYQSGSAYVFERAGAAWTETAKLGQYLGPYDDFGWSVAIEGDTIVVGARMDDQAGDNRGAVHVFSTCNGAWIASEKIVPCQLYVHAEFGDCVAISGGSILAGAPQDAGAIAGSGAAYLFRIPPGPVPTFYCTAKINSCGALPSIGTSGAPSASAASGFQVFVQGTPAGRPGLLLYTDAGRSNVPFEGGTLCLAPGTVLRSVALAETTGTPGACDGRLDIDMNLFASGGLGGAPSPVLRIAGTRIFAQFRGRDAAGSSLLSDAVTYVICP
jgi:hypothetical protein